MQRRKYRREFKVEAVRLGSGIGACRASRSARRFHSLFLPLSDFQGYDAALHQAIGSLRCVGEAQLPAVRWHRNETRLVGTLRQQVLGVGSQCPSLPPLPADESVRFRWPWPIDQQVGSTPGKPDPHQAIWSRRRSRAQYSSKSSLIRILMFELPSRDLRAAHDGPDCLSQAYGLLAKIVEEAQGRAGGAFSPAGLGEL